MSSRAWLGALAAIAAGAVAGYFVSHPLPLTRTVFAALYTPVQSLIGGWLNTPERYLVSSAVVSALPTILVLGLALGLLLPRLSYPRLLMYALLLWPLWFTFSRLLGWLRENIHTQGRRHDTMELVRRVTGAELSPQPLLGYLRERYGGLYLK